MFIKFCYSAKGLVREKFITIITTLYQSEALSHHKNSLSTHNLVTIQFIEKTVRSLSHHVRVLRYLKISGSWQQDAGS